MLLTKVVEFLTKAPVPGVRNPFQVVHPRNLRDSQNHVSYCYFLDSFPEEIIFFKQNSQIEVFFSKSILDHKITFKLLNFVMGNNNNK